MNGGKECVGDRVEVFVADGGKIREIDSQVGRRRFFAAIDGNAMAPLHQSSGKFLRKRLEPAIRRGNSARTQDGDFHTGANLSAGGFLSRENPGRGFRSRTADRCVGEPACQIFVRYAAPAHNIAALRQHTTPVLRDVCKCF